MNTYRSFLKITLMIALCQGLVTFGDSSIVHARTSLAGLQNQINEVENEVANLDEQLVGIQNQINVAQANLEAQIDDLVSSQNAQDELISAIQTAVTLLQEHVSLNAEDIEALQAVVDYQGQLVQALENNLYLLEERVLSNENDITAIVLADQNMQELVLAIQNQISSLVQLINSNDGDIIDLREKVTILENKLLAVQMDLSTKQNRINGVCSPNYSIRQINADGTVVCEYDTVSAGSGTIKTIRVYDGEEIPGSGLLVGQLTQTVVCPSTFSVTGGGYEISSFGDVWPGDPRLVNVTMTRPYGNGWYVHVINDNVVVCGFGSCSGQSSLHAYAICAKVQ